MTEEEIVAFEQRGRKVGGNGESPFAHRFPFAPVTSTSSPHTSFTFRSISSVPYIIHFTISKYFEGLDREHIDEIIEEKTCRDVPLGQTTFDAVPKNIFSRVSLGQTAYDAAHKRHFHLFKEYHETPEQVQHDFIDDDMILRSTGQTAYDAAQKYPHWHGNGGDHGYGGKTGHYWFSEREL